MSKVTVFRATAGDLPVAVSRCLVALGHDTGSFCMGKRVLIKANFNSPHRYPASSSLDLVCVLARAFTAAGAARVTVGDSCGLRWLPAEDVHRTLGVPAALASVGAVGVNFDAGSWRRTTVAGRHVGAVSIAEAVGEADMMVYACCMKTHPAAGFSMSLKHAIGFLPPDQRRSMHAGDMAQKIADVNRAVKPDLVFADARKCFVTGGPARGWVRRPGMLLASTDRIAMDVEGLRILSSYRAWNRVRKNPWDNPQIRHAVDAGIGVRDESDYDVTGD